MREYNLIVKPNSRLIAKRVSERPKPRPERPKEWWGIDMTKVMTDSGWVYVVIVLIINTFVIHTTISIIYYIDNVIVKCYCN